VDMATVGRTSQDLASEADTISSVLHAYSTKVERISPAEAKITVSFSAPQYSTTTITTATDAPVIDLEQCPIPISSDGNAQISMTTSLLIGGATESGKSNLVWYILSQLNSYQIPYRLHVIDPAGGVELADLEDAPTTRRYVDRVSQVPSIVTAFHKSMEDRLSEMKSRRVRRHFPTPTAPLEILIIDELLLCKSELKNGDPSSPIGEILSVGRKALHIVIACTQLGQKDATIGHSRDLFNQRACLQTRSQELTDTVLGTGATVDGAVCHRIINKGEGYVFTDQSGTFEKFQAPLVENTWSVAHGGITTPDTPSPSTRAQQLRQRRKGRTFVYQFYSLRPSDPQHSNYNRPQYVGITHNPKQRFREHEKGNNSFPHEVWQSFDHSRTKITAYPTWQQAKDMETDLIEYYQPPYNIQERN